MLVVQTLRRRRFSTHEIRLLRAIAAQVGGIIMQARLLEDLKTKEKERREYRRRMVAAIKRLQAYEKTSTRPAGAPRGRARARLNGLAAAPGFGRGQAHLLQPPVSFSLIDETGAEDPAEERRRFRRALAESATELGRLKQRLSARLPEFDPAVIETHRLMLEDQGFIGKVESAIDHGLSAEAALKRVVDEYLAEFARMSDGYLRDRAVDLKDVGIRILRNLAGVEEPERPLAKDSVRDQIAWLRARGLEPRLFCGGGLIQTHQKTLTPEGASYRVGANVQPERQSRAGNWGLAGYWPRHRAGAFRSRSKSCRRSAQ